MFASFEFKIRTINGLQTLMNLQYVEGDIKLYSLD